MTSYRLFILDSKDHLVSGLDIRCASDAEALEWAAFILARDGSGELWCGSRHVGRIQPPLGHLHASPPGLRRARRRPAPRQDRPAQIALQAQG